MKESQRDSDIVGHVTWSKADWAKRDFFCVAASPPLPPWLTGMMAELLEHRTMVAYQEAKDKYRSSHILTFTAICWTHQNHFHHWKRTTMNLYRMEVFIGSLSIVNGICNSVTRSFGLACYEACKMLNIHPHKTPPTERKSIPIPNIFPKLHHDQNPFKLQIWNPICL